MSFPFLSATKLIRALRQRKIGALELLELYAQRIKRYDHLREADRQQDHADGSGVTEGDRRQRTPYTACAASLHA